MIKVTMEFTLPEDKEEFELARDAHKMRDLINDVRDFLRAQWKYVPEEERLGATELWEEFCMRCSDNNVAVWEE